MRKIVGNLLSWPDGGGLPKCGDYRALRHASEKSSQTPSLTRGVCRFDDVAAILDVMFNLLMLRKRRKLNGSIFGCSSGGSLQSAVTTEIDDTCLKLRTVQYAGKSCRCSGTRENVITADGR